MRLMTLVAATLMCAPAFAQTLEVDIPASKPVERGYMYFGSVPANSTSTQVLTLTNNGNEPLTGITAKITGYGFSMKNKCPSTLKAGESCKAKITFWPSSPGGYSGRLYVTTSVKDYDYDLSGYGERDPFPQPPFPNPPIPPTPHP